MGIPFFLFYKNKYLRDGQIVESVGVAQIDYLAIKLSLQSLFCPLILSRSISLRNNNAWEKLWTKTLSYDLLTVREQIKGCSINTKSEQEKSLWDGS